MFPTLVCQPAPGGGTCLAGGPLGGGWQDRVRVGGACVGVTSGHRWFHSPPLLLPPSLLFSPRPFPLFPSAPSAFPSSSTLAPSSSSSPAFPRSCLLTFLLSHLPAFLLSRLPTSSVSRSPVSAVPPVPLVPLVFPVPPVPLVPPSLSLSLSRWPRPSVGVCICGVTLWKKKKKRPGGEEEEDRGRRCESDDEDEKRRRCRTPTLAGRQVAATGARGSQKCCISAVRGSKLLIPGSVGSWE